MKKTAAASVILGLTLCLFTRSEARADGISQGAAISPMVLCAVMLECFEQCEEPLESWIRRAVSPVMTKVEVELCRVGCVNNSGLNQQQVEACLGLAE